MKNKNTKKSNLSSSFFIIESIIFLTTQFLGLYTAWVLYSIPEMKETIVEQDISLVNFLVAFFIGTAVLFILTKIIKKKRHLRSVFLYYDILR